MTLRLNKNLLKNSGIGFLLFIYYLFGIMVSFNSLNLSERINNKLGVASILLVVFVLILRGKTEKVNIGYNTLFILLTICVVFSAIFHFSLMLFWCTCCGLIIFIVLPKLKFDTVNSYGILFYPYLIACLVALYLYNVSSFNSQGIIYTFLGVLLLNWLCLKKKTTIVGFGVVVFVIVLLLSLTRSRTSMLVFLITALFTYCYLFGRKLTVKSLAIHAVVVCGLFIVYEFLMKFFVDVFFHKWVNTDLTSNRTAIWNMVFERTSFWGHGEEYLNGFDAHNTFMQILDMFGFMAFVLTVLCILSVFLKIRSSTHKIVFLNFFTAWTFASIFEDLNFFTSRMLPVTMLFFLHIALLSNEIRINKLKSNSSNCNGVSTR